MSTGRDAKLTFTREFDSLVVSGRQRLTLPPGAPSEFSDRSHQLSLSKHGSEEKTRQGYAVGILHGIRIAEVLNQARSLSTAFLRSSPIIHTRSPVLRQTTSRQRTANIVQKGTSRPRGGENESSPIVHTGSTRVGCNAVPVCLFLLFAGLA